jgi:hypothetical protein
MEKDAIFTAVRQYGNIQNEITRKIGQLDPELPKEVKNRRSNEIKAEYAEQLQSLDHVLTNAKNEAQAKRLAHSEPLPSLFKAAIRQADKVTPGHAILAQSLGLLGTDALVSMVPEMRNTPALLVAAWSEVQKRDDAKVAQSAFQAMAAQFLDWPAIKSFAEIEHTVNAVRLESMARNGGDPTDKLTLGREQEHLGAILAS